MQETENYTPNTCAEWLTQNCEAGILPNLPIGRQNTSVRIYAWILKCMQEVPQFKSYTRVPTSFLVLKGKRFQEQIS